MAWNFYLQGLPPELDARLTDARTSAELALLDAKVGRPRWDRERHHLIDVRILPEVIEYASCLCEVARRRLLPVSEVEHRVDEYLRTVAGEIMGRFFLGLFVQEAVDRVRASDEWRAYLMERRSVANQLAAADSAAGEVERRVETPATLAASAVDEGQTEPPIAPLLTPEPATAAADLIRGRRPNSAQALQALMDDHGWHDADLEVEGAVTRKTIRQMRKNRPTKDSSWDKLRRVLVDKGVKEPDIPTGDG